MPNAIGLQVPQTALLDIWPAAGQMTDESPDDEGDEDSHQIPMGMIATKPESGRVKIVWFKPTVSEVVTSTDDSEAFPSIVSQHLSLFQSAWSGNRELLDEELHKLSPVAATSVQISFASHLQSHSLLSNVSLFYVLHMT